MSNEQRACHLLRVVSIVFLAGLMVACAPAQWHRPGSSQADLAEDKRNCAIESGNETGVSDLRTSRYVSTCLKERGWLEGKAPPGTVDPAVTVSPAPQAAPLTFDECFERCRSLTDRTKEQCFDTCLER